MDGQRDEQSRRKFLTGAGVVGAAAAVAGSAAAKTAAVPPQTELSPAQISKLEEIVKNFITNAKATNGAPQDHPQRRRPKRAPPRATNRELLRPICDLVRFAVDTRQRKHGVLALA